MQACVLAELLVLLAVVTQVTWTKLRLWSGGSGVSFLSITHVLLDSLNMPLAWVPIPIWYKHLPVAKEFPKFPGCLCCTGTVLGEHGLQNT